YYDNSGFCSKKDRSVQQFTKPFLGVCQSTRIAAIRVDFCVAAEIQGTCYKVWLKKVKNDPYSDIIDHRNLSPEMVSF
ncbi:MAG: hypothetical protein ACLS76_06365, partial [Eubacterium callanderi]